MHDERLAQARDAFARDEFLETLGFLNTLMDVAENADVTELLGETLEKLGFAAEAAAAFETTANLNPEKSAACLKRAANLYGASGDDDRALLAALECRKKAPEDPDIAFLLAGLFRKSGDLTLIDLVKGPLAASENPEHLSLVTELLAEDEKDPATLDVFRKLAALAPDDPYRQYKYLSVARDFCDYEAIERQERHIAEQEGKLGIAFRNGEAGYSNLLYCADERLNRQAINNGTITAPLSRTLSVNKRVRGHRWKERIRIGYLSSDFWDNHATMRLFQSVLEAHDTARFEVTLFCHTPEKLMAFDNGNRAKWGKIVRIADLSDAQSAAKIRAAGTDILVDLKGHTGGSRARLLNTMLAPVQVAWLGFPGSTVGIDCDYVIGDPVVLPDNARPHYHEKFCRLPECYQPNDPVYRAYPAAASREALGLPKDRFVFAAFNTPRKVSLFTLDLWAKILKRVPNSVLWIMIDGPVPRGNFLAAMEKRGVPAQQILFAPKMNYPSHIARLQAADIGLDTFPYNGHTTTSDKLWAGLPVLTLKGSNFASRVSESLLNAIGLESMVAEKPEAFVEAAVALSQDSARVSELKATIDANRFKAPLFDAERFCRHLELAFETMAKRAKTGAAPEHFDVPRLPQREAAFR